MIGGKVVTTEGTATAKVGTCLLCSRGYQEVTVFGTE